MTDGRESIKKIIMRHVTTTLDDKVDQTIIKAKELFIKHRINQKDTVTITFDIVISTDIILALCEPEN